MRDKRARIDDQIRRSWIETVREFIFERGHSVVSKAVENLIGDKSLVPTRVRAVLFSSHDGITYPSLFRMLSLSN